MAIHFSSSQTMAADTLSLFDKARRSAMPSDDTLRRLGYYDEALQPFLREYKENHIGFQPVFVPTDRPDPTDMIVDPAERDGRPEEKRRGPSLSERLRKVHVKASEPDDNFSHEMEEGYRAKLRSRRVNTDSQ
ncbi:hypothetical protein XU18_0550 [Perkinsela sp. CCAP 1560/4]|nr:hypothetical protein XU18_0550 [Perkinsela sp. CCAP 1560/4]|eukprot:KNH09272.1 hypothetical protein XU18_0550 [Perkinsela sp. CCAP 1560/4]